MQQHTQSIEQGLVLDHLAERVRSARRSDGSEANPSCSNTRETIGESQIPFNVGIGSEILTDDETESVKITTDGKFSKITLTPIPNDSVLPQVAHIDWVAFSFMPKEDQYDPILNSIVQLASLLGLQSMPAIATGGGWNGNHRTLSRVIG
jgi:hypothetical protein